MYKSRGCRRNFGTLAYQHMMIMMKKSFKSHSGSYKLVVGGGELYKLEAVIKIERAGIWIIYSTMDGMTTIIIAKCVCMCVA